MVALLLTVNLLFLDCNTSMPRPLGNSHSLASVKHGTKNKPPLQQREKKVNENRLRISYFSTLFDCQRWCVIKNERSRMNNSGKKKVYQDERVCICKEERFARLIISPASHSFFRAFFPYPYEYSFPALFPRRYVFYELQKLKSVI